MKMTMKLSEIESLILRDVCYARMKVLKAGKMEDPEAVPIHTELNDFLVRQCLPAFDFFRCAMEGNELAVRRQADKQREMGPHAGGEYYDGMIADYQGTMNNLMQGGHYGVEEVVRLQNRLKGFIKEAQTPPARTLYIADCHFYHDRICREMDRRGFSGFEEMNAYMVEQWNSKVRDRDDVYILGDFSIAKADATAKILRQLKGKLHLLIGNHDKYLADRSFDRSLFRSIEPYQEIRDNGRQVILSHYPVFCYKGQYRRDKVGNPLTYMLYGHVHNTHDERLINRFIMETREMKVTSKYVAEPQPIPCNMINCFCMFSDYKPLTLSEWIDVDRKRREEQPDRRKENGTSRADTE